MLEKHHIYVIYHKIDYGPFYVINVHCSTFKEKYETCRFLFIELVNIYGQTNMVVCVVYNNSIVLVSVRL